MSPLLEKITLQILGYGVTPYAFDYQSVTKTIFISPGPPTFLRFPYIYSRFPMFYVYIYTFFCMLLILL